MLSTDTQHNADVSLVCAMALVYLLMCILPLLVRTAIDAEQTQPITFTYLDDILHRALEEEYPNLYQNLNSLQRNIHHRIRHCLITTLQKWIINDAENSDAGPKRKQSNICGAIAYYQPTATLRKWKIQVSRPDVGILLNVKYINLPYFALDCYYANIQLGLQSVYCGKITNLLHFFEDFLRVTFHQKSDLYSGTGFFATYQVMDKSFFQKAYVYQRIYQLSSINLSTELLLPRLINNTFPRVWKFVAQRNQRIKFKVSHGCIIHDGPGPLSPVILRNELLTTSYHLFIIQTNESFHLEYQAIKKIDLKPLKDFVLESSLYRNSVHGFKVNPGAYALTIHFLSIHSQEVVNDFPVRCLYGGLFIQSNVNNTNFLEMCETDINREFQYQISNQNYAGPIDIYFITFAG